MSIKVKYVYNMGEYYTTIASIADEIKKNKKGSLQTKAPTLWFRGESQIQYTLIPSLFRENKGVSSCKEGEQYSDFHYAEDIRLQHYNAKNYHYLDKEPSSRIEWLEVMQHHGVNTRVLDWSESSTHSLLFAIEPFCKKENAFNKEHKLDVSPCIWVLDPQGLNKELLGTLGKDTALQKKLLSNLHISDEETDKIMKRIAYLSEKDNMETYMELDSTHHINYLMNLSAINDEIYRDSEWLGAMLTNNESVNPLYYLLSRVYSDGYILDKYDLPPLAVVHPYHSERIKAQKGVFTVFPFYKVGSQRERRALKKISVNPDSMSFNKIAQKYLYKIILCKPQQITYEMLTNGMNESWLYPEMPIVSNEIEHHGVC